VGRPPPPQFSLTCRPAAHPPYLIQCPWWPSSGVPRASGTPRDSVAARPSAASRPPACLGPPPRSGTPAWPGPPPRPSHGRLERVGFQQRGAHLLRRQGPCSGSRFSILFPTFRFGCVQAARFASNWWSVFLLLSFILQLLRMAGYMLVLDISVPYVFLYVPCLD
jgi:hypothetical protein